MADIDPWPDYDFGVCSFVIQPSSGLNLNYVPGVQIDLTSVLLNDGSEKAQPFLAGGNCKCF